MPQRRGLRGGAEQGLSTLSQILASLLQNRMTGERQQEIISAQNEAISEREDARVAEARARMGLDPNASPQEVAEVIRQRNQQKASVEAGQEAADIPLDESGGMTGLLEAFRAAPPGSPQKQAIGRRLASRGFVGGPAPPPGTTGGNEPTPVPSLQGAQRLGDLQRSRQFEDEARSAEAGREPIDSAAERARRTAEASRRTPEQTEADAAAQRRGTLGVDQEFGVGDFGGGKQSQAQVDAAARLPLLDQAHQQASQLEESGAPVIRSNLPDALNWLRGEQGQLYRNAVRTVGITSLKTLFPGQLSDQEREAGLSLIVPDIGDRAETIATKARRRAALVDLVRRQAAGEQIDISPADILGGGPPQGRFTIEGFVPGGGR